jgi:hypothetical protein
MSEDVKKWHSAAQAAYVAECSGYPVDEDSLSAAVRAFLAAAEADGAVFTLVPERMDWRHAEGAAQGFKVKGWNDCIAAVLAWKVTV